MVKKKLLICTSFVLLSFILLSALGCDNSKKSLEATSSTEDISHDQTEEEQTVLTTESEETESRSEVTESKSEVTDSETDIKIETTSQFEETNQGDEDTQASEPSSTTNEETTAETEALCVHSYENQCSTVCLLCGDVRAEQSNHVYSQFDTCYDITCVHCGFVLEQDHDWKYHSSTATLLSPGTLTLKCSECKVTEMQTVDKLDPALLGMPVVYITDVEEATIPLLNLKKADGEILVKYSFVSNSSGIGSFECISKIKVQGASSSGHPKKNYNVKFFTDETLDKKLKVDLGWGKENKYTMKANYIDSSQARNVIGAQLFSQVVASRDSIATGLSGAPNYGVIDGFPILVYVNGEFHGLYTMNIPKDDWMFGMEGGEESREAMLMADAWTNSVNLRETIGDGDWSEYGWELEHCSTADDSWVRESFNKLIELLNCNDMEKIMVELPYHLDIDAAIDNMIYTFFINTADNVAKNILWATYDGRTWIPSMYDMDGSFGIYWNGTPIPIDSTDHNATPRNTFPSINADGSLFIPGNKMYKILIEYYPERVRARYAELRRTVFSFQNINNTFNSFFDKIPEIAYVSEIEKWTKIPYAEENRDNMFLASKEQLLRLDAFFYNIGT